jgi:putative ABC transport system permease protein
VRAVLVKIGADVRRRRIQTALVVLVTLLASSAATISLTVLVRSSAPFDETFERVSGPHLVFHVDAAKVGPEQLRSTASVPVVMATGDPHPIAIVPIQVGDRKSTVELVGRDDPGGRVDRLELVAGRWVQGPGEIVVTRFNAPEGAQLRIILGETVRILSRADRPAFVVVGEVVDVGEYSGSLGGRAWVLGNQLVGLVDPDASPLGYEMAYRVRDSSTQDGLTSDATEIQAALPIGSSTRPPTSWVLHKQGMAWALTLLSSTLLAFTVFTLIAAALIVANTITGAVLASRREIGVMKAVGYTPTEVALVYVGQLLAAAAAGAIPGVVLGIAASKPLLELGGTAIGLPPASPLYLPGDVAVFAGVLVIVTLAALVPSLRAASTNAVHALAVGLAQPGRGRQRLGRWLERFRLPRPISLGVDDAFLRPARGVMTMFALVIGVVTLAFGVGISGDAEPVLADKVLMGTNYEVRVDRFGAYPDSAVMTTLSGIPEVSTVVAQHQTNATIPGVKDPILATVMRGDAGRLSYHAYQGRWFESPGEVLLRPVTMKEAHLKLGDVFQASIEGHTVELKVVGGFTDWTVFDGRGLVLGWPTFANLLPSAEPDSYLVKLHSPTDADAIAAAIQRSEPDFLKSTAIHATTVTDAAAPLIALQAPALLLLFLAAVSVFNTMVLNSRERSFDIAVLKAFGMDGKQVVTMVLAPAILLSVIAVVIGLPVGVWLHALLVRSMFEVIGGVFDTSHSFGFISLLLIALGGVATAVLGALLPATWAARASVATVLRAE